MAKYYFDASGKCVFCEVQNPTGIANNSGLTGYTGGLTLSGTDKNYLELDKCFLVGGVLKGRNDVVLSCTVAGAGQITVTVTSAAYWPVQVWIGENYYGAWRLVTIPNSTPVTYSGFHSQNIIYAQVMEDYNLTARNYQVNSCVCDSCDCGGCCFPSGNKVLMEDRTWKDIETIEEGERVVGIDGEINTVISPYHTTLKNDRSILTFSDKSLYWCCEHLLWTRNPVGEEYWGTHDYNQYLAEKHPYTLANGQVIDYDGLTKKEPFILPKSSYDYAHIDGWKKQTVMVDRTFGDETPVHSLALTGSHTFIVNGYVVAGFVSDHDYDFSKIKWNGLKEGV